MHLESFLRVSTAQDPTSARFRAHAERTLAQLQGAADDVDGQDQDPSAPSGDDEGSAYTDEG
jgi:hypothetical protein